MMRLRLSLQSYTTKTLFFLFREIYKPVSAADEAKRRCNPELTKPATLLMVA